MSATTSQRVRGAGRRDGDTTELLDAIPSMSTDELVAVLSQALDLAEGRPKGHALRVSYISSLIARELGLSAAQRDAAFFAGLLHDAGVPSASEKVGTLPRVYEHDVFAAAPLQTAAVLASRIGPEYIETIAEAFHEHAYQGASAVAALGLPPAVAEAVLCSHERFDGSGYPLGVAGNDIPIVARIIAVADYAEALLATDSSSLLARRRLEAGLREQAGRAFDSRIIEVLATAARADGFWLGLYSQNLVTLVVELHNPTPQPAESTNLLQLAATFADICDAKNRYKRGHSRRVAMFASGLAAALGYPAGHVQAIELAATLYDVGLLRAPARIIDKPEILTIQEMSLLREHPRESADIIASYPDWAPLADWVAAHHERLDGRGYPDAVNGDEIPVESRVLAISDIFEALTATRPHRPAMDVAAALELMRGMAGHHIDPEILAVFEQIVPELVAQEQAGDRDAA